MATATGLFTVTDIIDGVNGTNGTNGTNGADGTNGTNGTNGVDGDNGRSVAQLQLFRRATSTPADPSGGVFNFSTQTLTTVPTGWFVAIPTGTDPVYTALGSASIIGQTGTTTPTWGSADLAYQNGADGTDGTNGTNGAPGSNGTDGTNGTNGSNGQSTLLAKIFRRSASALSTPTGGSFNFGTNVLTPPSGWSISVPSGTNPVYSTTGLFSIIGDSGTDSTVTWASPQIEAQNGTDGSNGTNGSNGADGTNGVNGLSTYLVVIFRRSASALATPTGGSYNFGTNTTTPPSGWSTSVPTGTNPLYVSTALASVSGATGTDNTLTWVAPTIMARDGADGADGTNGSNGTNGTNGSNGAAADIYKTIYLFQNGTSTPSAPSNTQGFTASTGNAANTGSWTTGASVPSAGQTIYVASALLVQTGGTGNWAVSGTWSANPAASSGTNGSDGQDGTNGTNGTNGAPGADGTNGTNGSNGSDAPRFGETTLYRAATSVPSAPSARITWSTGAIDNITSGWSRTPPTQTANSTSVTYSSQLVFIDVSSPFTTTTATGGTPTAAFNFDGLVTFTGGDFAVDGSTITNIDGGNIATNTITTNSLEVSANDATIYSTLPTSSTSGTARSTATGMYFNSIHNRIEIWDNGNLRMLMGGLDNIPSNA